MQNAIVPGILSASYRFTVWAVGHSSVEFRHTSGYEDNKSSADPDLGARASIGRAFGTDSLFAR